MWLASMRVAFSIVTVIEPLIVFAAMPMRVPPLTLVRTVLVVLPLIVTAVECKCKVQFSTVVHPPLTPTPNVEKTEVDEKDNGAALSAISDSRICT
jgi:hypothetical protein